MTGTTTVQAHAYWHILTGFIPELVITLLVVVLAVGLAVKFMRKL
jgi:hypothetical protein